MSDVYHKKREVLWQSGGGFETVERQLSQTLITHILRAARVQNKTAPRKTLKSIRETV